MEHKEEDSDGANQHEDLNIATNLLQTPAQRSAFDVSARAEWHSLAGVCRLLPAYLIRPAMPDRRLTRRGVSRCIFDLCFSAINRLTDRDENRSSFACRGASSRIAVDRNWEMDVL